MLINGYKFYQSGDTIYRHNCKYSSALHRIVETLFGFSFQIIILISARVQINTDNKITAFNYENGFLSTTTIDTTVELLPNLFCKINVLTFKKMDI